MWLHLNACRGGTHLWGGACLQGQGGQGHSEDHGDPGQSWPETGRYPSRGAGPSIIGGGQGITWAVLGAMAPRGREGAIGCEFLNGQAAQPAAPTAVPGTELPTFGKLC